MPEPDSTDSEAQREEREALATIFPSLSVEQGPSGLYTYRLPCSSPTRLCIRITLPERYPSAERPWVEVPDEWSEAVGKGLKPMWDGDACLYEYITFLKNFVEEHSVGGDQNGKNGAVGSSVAGTEETTLPLPESLTRWTSSLITDRKSHFQAFLTPVASPTDLADFLATLKRCPKIARATHVVLAYRYRDERGVLQADYDDDGEREAGGRVLVLMERMQKCGYAVAVARWFGGIKLGPDRFRHIQHAAAEVLRMVERGV